MQLSFEPFTVHKRFALRISRGSTQATTNLWVRLQQDGLEGWGEASPFSTGQQSQTTELLSEALTTIAPALVHLDPWNHQQFEDLTRSLADWLVESGVIYLEQPLAKGQEADLLQLRDLPLPVFVDESAWTSQDVAALSDRVDGINLKLLKTGGLTEALRAIHTARAHGLQLMLGCYSDSSLLNSAAAQLGPLVDYLDLDSHLNLLDDPFNGATIAAGRLVPSDRPGLGVLRQE